MRLRAGESISRVGAPAAAPAMRRLQTMDLRLQLLQVLWLGLHEAVRCRTATLLRGQQISVQPPASARDFVCCFCTVWCDSCTCLRHTSCRGRARPGGGVPLVEASRTLFSRFPHCSLSPRVIQLWECSDIVPDF